MVRLHSNGKVILKDGKVSCSCCEEGCCMYPADKLGDTYEAADLPDEIRIVIPLDPVRDEIATRSGSTFTGDSTRVRFVDRSDDDEVNIWQVEYDEPAESGNWLDFAQLDCLIRGDGNLTPGDDLVEDQFADCYEVSGGNMNGSESVFRQSLCLWFYGEDAQDDNTVFVQYGYDGDDGWFVFDGEDVYKKQDPQNNPEGTYDIPVAGNLETGFSFTVTEC
jgi:hypothetical protein